MLPPDALKPSPELVALVKRQRDQAHERGPTPQRPPIRGSVSAELAGLIAKKGWAEPRIDEGVAEEKVRKIATLNGGGE